MLQGREETGPVLAYIIMLQGCTKVMASKSLDAIMRKVDNYVDSNRSVTSCFIKQPRVKRKSFSLEQPTLPKNYFLCLYISDTPATERERPNDVRARYEDNVGVVSPLPMSLPS